MPEKVPCIRCGAAILPETASETGGLCMPCKTGTREAIDEARRHAKLERELDHSDPFRLHWRALVERACSSEPGFDGLSDSEKTYFAVSELAGEVYNGGFDQYFFNSSGSHYDFALRGLAELRASRSLALLEHAKDLLFPDRLVPLQIGERRDHLRAPRSDEIGSRLALLDSEFWEDPDDLVPRLREFALRNGLVVAV